MCCKNFWKKIVPFALAFAFGLLTANLLSKEAENIKPQNKTIYVGYTGDGTGSRRGVAACGTRNQPSPDADGEPVKTVRSELTSARFLSKPRADYTDAARENQVQGTVRLRVTFLANGQIGAITPVGNLPDGLTEQAITAARQIKFEPARRDGAPVTVTKIVEYTFTLY
jgi:TonB family protein